MITALLLRSLFEPMTLYHSYLFSHSEKLCTEATQTHRHMEACTPPDRHPFALSNARAHTHMHTHKHTHMHTHTNTHTHTHTYTNTHTHTQAHTHTSTHAPTDRKGLSDGIPKALASFWVGGRLAIQRAVDDFHRILDEFTVGVLRQGTRVDLRGGYERYG